MNLYFPLLLGEGASPSILTCSILGIVVLGFFFHFLDFVLFCNFVLVLVTSCFCKPIVLSR